MRVLVTGGAGYIGSVAVELLLADGHEVAVLDNLWRGHAAAIDPGVPLFAVDLRDQAAVRTAVGDWRPEVIMHFAAASIVPESMRDPELYYSINVDGSAHLIAAAREAGVERFVFSSTAATYGVPATMPIAEQAPTVPINNYGRTKLMVEQKLAHAAESFCLRYVAFRYFNVAGATAQHGEAHDPETHVIPVALLAMRGDRPPFSIFGTDYPTPDGTAIRDYVHVADLARAHILALAPLAERSLGPINLGSDRGYSVREIVQAVEAVTAQPLPVVEGPRREGDPPVLIADASRARTALGWTPTQTTLPAMIGSAWDWMQRHPNGYGD